jgi:hypothetical protein
LEQARQAITLVRGVGGHVTIPMIKLEYIKVLSHGFSRADFVELP